MCLCKRLHWISYMFFMCNWIFLEQHVNHALVLMESVMEPLECVHLVQQDGQVQIVTNVQMISLEVLVFLVLHVEQMEFVMTVNLDQETASVIQDSLVLLVLLVIAVVTENVLMELMEMVHVLVLVLLMEQIVINVSMVILEIHVKFVIVKILKSVIKEVQEKDVYVLQVNLEIIVILVQLVIMERVMKEKQEVVHAFVI